MIEQAIAVATSVGTLLMMWLAGKKKALAWKVGLANQVLWIIFIFLFQAWGLFILTAALTVIYARNLWLWRESEDSWASQVLKRPPVMHPSEYEGAFLVLERDNGEVMMIPRRG